jgi:molybdate transport system substrate-binding protein
LAKVADALGERLIYGANVRQVLNYVERGEVDAGIVYLTDAKEAGDRVKVVATADAAWHEPIVYPGAIVSASKKREAALKFLEYLGSERAKKLLEDRGFSTGAGAEEKLQK